jgi:hypothetical protein
MTIIDGLSGSAHYYRINQGGTAVAVNEGETPDAQAFVILWDQQGGSYFRVPEAIFDQYQLSDAERSEVSADLEASGYEAVMRPIPEDILASYRISADELVAMASPNEVEGHGQYIGRFPQGSVKFMGYIPGGAERNNPYAWIMFPSHEIVAMNLKEGYNPCPTLH